MRAVDSAWWAVGGSEVLMPEKDIAGLGAGRCRPGLAAGVASSAAWAEQ